jgi:hypothetical protein
LLGCLVAALGIVLPLAVAAAESRSAHQRAAFVKAHPCPSTGKPRGRCPGYVVDHVKPLCAGGADHPSNMQWQTIAAAKEKDREERKLCRSLQRRY